MIFRSVLTMVFVLGLVASCPANEEVIICGTGDSQKLLLTLAEAFHEERPDIDIEVPDSIGSRGGIRATANGECDLGRTARPFRKDEKRYNLQYRVFAYSPIVMAANANMKAIDNLTSSQVVGIYSGNITSWKELGGDDHKIYVANREHGDSSRIVMERIISGFRDIENFAGRIIYTTPETVETIAEYEYTIGYVPLSMTENTDLAVMKLDGVSPSIKNVRDGSYKLVSPFGIVWREKLEGPAGIFFDFLFSPQAEGIISRNGAVPVPAGQLNE